MKAIKTTKFTPEARQASINQLAALVSGQAPNVPKSEILGLINTISKQEEMLMQAVSELRNRLGPIMSIKSDFASEPIRKSEIESQIGQDLSDLSDRFAVSISHLRQISSGICL